MRRFDKIKNLKKANLLAEQRYLTSKGVLKENGPIVDIDGVSDYFVSQIQQKGEDYMGLKDAIYKTAYGDESTVRAIYSAIGQKLKGGEFDSVGQAYTSPMLGVNEELDETGLLEDKYSVDQLVALALENADLGQLNVIDSRRANFSSRYRHLNCVEFNAELPITVNFDGEEFYTLTINFEGYCEEDPDGPSGGINFSVELTDTSYDSNLFGKDLYDMVSGEVSKKLDELEREVAQYMHEDEDDY
jgi:hypothetical protein